MQSDIEIYQLDFVEQTTDFLKEFKPSYGPHGGFHITQTSDGQTKVSLVGNHGNIMTISGHYKNEVFDVIKSKKKYRIEITEIE